MAVSYRSPKTRVAPSSIHGRGLFAVRRIRRGEIVAVKGGQSALQRRYRGFFSAYVAGKIADMTLGSRAGARAGR